MGRILIAFVIAVALGALSVIILLPWAAPRLIAWQLRALGFEESALERARIGASELVLDRLQLASGLAAERVSLDYAPQDLIRGRLGELRIQGLRVDARVGPDGGLELPDLALEPGEGRDGAPLPLLPEAVRVQDALVVVALPNGTLELEAAAELEVDRSGPDRFELRAGRITGSIDGATLNASLALAGEVEPLADHPLATLEAAGSGSFDTQDIELAGLGSATFEGALDVAFDGARATFEMRQAVAVVEPATGSGLTWTAGVPGPVEIRVAPERTATLALDLAQPLGGRLALPLRAEAGRASAELVLATRLAAPGGLDRFRLDDLSVALQASDIPTTPAIGRLWLELQGAGSLREATLGGRLTLEADGPIGGASLSATELALPFTVEVAPEQIALAVADPGSLTIGSFQIAHADTRGRLRLALPAAPVLAVDRRPEPAWRLDLPLRLEGAEVAAGGNTLTGASGELRVAANGAGVEPARASVRLDGGQLTLPDQALALRGLHVEVPLVPEERASGAVPFRLENLRSLMQPALFAPVRMEGVVRPEPERIRFESTLTRSGVQLRLQGQYRQGRSMGRVSVELRPVRFAPDGLQPAALMPRAAGLMERVTGEVGLVGEVLIEPTGLRSDLELALRELGFVLGPVRVEGMTGVVAIDQPVPPSTLPGQELEIGLVDFGLAFTDGRMRFELLPGGPLDVRMLRFQWAGGRIAAQPFTVGSPDGVISLRLEASGLDLDQIFGQVDLPGLAGKGTIDGILPVRIEGGEATIDHGRLTARRAGWLRYRPEDSSEAFAAGGESMTLLLQALENFRYDELEITLDGRTDQAMDIRLHLKGANPGLYDGHPIEFNLNLEGELANILRQGLRSYTLPDRVREQIERSGER